MTDAAAGVTEPQQEEAPAAAEKFPTVENMVYAHHPDWAYLANPGLPVRPPTEEEAARYAAEREEAAAREQRIYRPLPGPAPAPPGAGFTPPGLPKRIPQAVRAAAADLPGPETSSVATGEAAEPHAPGNLAQVRAGEQDSTTRTPAGRDGPDTASPQAGDGEPEDSTGDTEVAGSSAKPLTESQETAARDVAAESAAVLARWTKGAATLGPDPAADVKDEGGEAQ